MSTTMNPTAAPATVEVDYDPFAEASLARVVPTTEPQREVWLADRLGREASLAYNEAVSLHFTGAFDANAMQQSLADLVQRHEALRATVSANGEELLIAEAATGPLVVLSDHTTAGAAQRDAAITAAKRRAVETPFDLSKGPLFRAEILEFGDTDHLLIIAAHHIVCDGWSFGVIIHDLAKLYAQRTGRSTAALPPAASYGDYATAQSGKDSAVAEKYWLARFAGPVPVLDLPADHARPAWRTFTSQREDHALDAALVAAVRKIGAQGGAGLFATLLAGFAVLMQRLSGSADVVIGVPAAGQSTDGLDSLVGHCVNLLPLRLDADGATGMRQLIGATQSAMLEAYEHQDLTYGALLKKLAVARDTSRLPLVSVMFNIDQALDANAVGFTDLKVDFAGVPRAFENFELFVNAVQVQGGLRLECQYNADLFDQATIRRWVACYEMLLRAVCADVDAPAGTLDMVPAADRQWLEQWNATSAEFDRNALIHELFETQTRRTPDQPAIVCGETTLSYRALDAAANRIAHSLRARGVRRGALVGLHVRRSPQMVAAMLGVLKAGGAYVPLDPGYPADRLAFMAEDAALAVLVTEAAISPRFPTAHGNILQLDADQAGIAAQPDSALARDGDAAEPMDRAYVIYTSGSTGKPKGVQVQHRAVVNFLRTMASSPGLTETDRIVAVTTLSFDIAVNELLLPLSIGAGIVLALPEQSGDGAVLAKLMRDSGATVMQATPATWRLLLEAGWRGSSAFKAWCGGEALSADLARQLRQRTGALWNLYGPTEATVWATACLVDSEAISIGRPIANTTVWILDEGNGVCPIGVPGEIWIGGDCVTLGYLNRPELTAERFIADPFSTTPGARLYRTGDRGRWRESGTGSGTIEHLGRLDFQVKVRGFRIELGEIEAGLQTHPGVVQVVVIAREDRPGDVRLVAYVVPQPGTEVGEEALKKYLGASLPEYMIPQHIVPLPAIPLLPNGKINRAALPAPRAAAAANRQYVAPRDELEKAVAAEMEAALGMPGVGIHDDFFSLGGHSLLAAQLTARLNRSLDLQLTMRAVFAAPTIARLAEYIRGAAPMTQKPIELLPDRHEAPMSLMQERLWFLDELYPGRVTYNAPSAHRLTGAMNEAAFERAFREILRRQPALRTGFIARDGSAVQVIRDDISVALFPAEDLSALPAAERAQQLQRRLEELTDETFDLSQAPLFKARLFRLGADEHVLFFMPHHIVWDGWSFDLLYEEMSALYAAFCDNRPNPLPELRIHYGDFSAWHRDWTSGPDFARQLAFWRERLEGIAGTQELPVDKPRHPGMSGAGKTEWVVVDAERTAALHNLSKQSGTTLFVTTLALYSVLLHDYSRLTNLVLGTPVRGRNSLELESIMGFFNNLVPLQLPIKPDESFVELINRIKATVVESFASPDVPLEHLSRELSTRHGAGKPVLYQALFSFQDARQRIQQWAGLKHEVIPLFQRGATEDLGMWFLESTKGLQGGITYNTDIITDATAEELHRRYLRLLDAVIANPAATVATLLAGNQPWQRAATTAMAAAPARPRTAGGDAASAPATEMEKLLAEIWREQLKIATITTQDNFFDLGGHSLLAMQAILAMESKTGKRVDRGRYIFESLGQIARAYAEAAPEPVQKQGRLRSMLSGILGGKKS